MKLRLSYVGINTDSTPPILTTDTGMQVLATPQAVGAAYAEAEQFIKAIGRIHMSNSIIEQDKLIDAYLSRKQSPDAVAGEFPCTDTKPSET